MVSQKCSCGASFEDPVKLAFHCRIRRKCEPEVKTKKRKRTVAFEVRPESPPPRRVALPPLLGGEGHVLQTDNLFVEDDDVSPRRGRGEPADSYEAPAPENGEDEKSEGDGRSSEGPSPPSSDDEGGSDATALDYDSASLEEYIEAYKILNYHMSCDRRNKRAQDQFLKLIVHPRFAELRVGNAVKERKLDSVKSIVDNIRASLHEEMKEQGFSLKKVWHPDTSRKEFVWLWQRDAKSCLKAQLRRARTRRSRGSGNEPQNFWTEPMNELNRRGEKAQMHPMSGEVARHAIPEIVREICNHPTIEWRAPAKEEDDPIGISSCVLLLQMYSDISSMSLSSNALSFYPLHCTFLNFATSVKNNIVVKGDAVIAYLPTDAKWIKESGTLHEIHAAYDGFEGSNELEYNHYINCCEAGSDVDEDDVKNDDEAETDAREKTDPLSKLVGEEKPGQEIFSACFKYCFDGVKDEALSGMEFEDAEGRKWRGHSAVASYVADQPEVSKITGVVDHHCHLCHVALNERNCKFSEECKPRRRDPDFARVWHERRDEARASGDRKRRKEAVDALEGEHLHLFQSPLQDWPLNHIEGLELYEIFRFEHMHCQSIGNFIHDARVVINRMNDTKMKTNNMSKLNKETSTYEVKDGKRSTLRSKRDRVLGAMNTHLETIERDWPCIGFHVNLRRKKLVSDLDGFFREDRLASMLEAKHYKNLAEVMPFVGALADRLTQEITEENKEDVEPLLSQLFTSYAELDQAITKRDRVDRSFAESDYATLAEKIAEHADILANTDIRSSQNSEFNYKKMQMALMHTEEAIRALGSIFNFDSGVWETSHLIYKFFFRLGSKRKTSSMEETLIAMTTSKLSRTHLESTFADGVRGELVFYMVTGRRSERQPRFNAAKAAAARADSALLTKRGKKFTGKALDDILSRVEKGEVGKQSFQSEKGMKQIFKGTRTGSSFHNANAFIHQCGGPNFLAKPVWDIIKSRALKHLVKSSSSKSTSDAAAGIERGRLESYAMESLAIEVLNSMYVPGIDSPTSDDVSSENRSTGATLRLQDNGERHLQRCIAATRFSHGKKRWQDCILIRDKADGEDGKFAGWVAKALAFVRISCNEGYFSAESHQDMVVVRYFEVIPRHDMDRIDSVLGCVKLAWATIDGEPWVDVLPISTVAGRVHVVPDGLHTLSEAEASCYEATAETWKERRFFVNRFKTSFYEAKFMTVDAASITETELNEKE